MTQRGGSVAFAFTTSGAIGPIPTDGYTYITGLSFRETGGSNPVSVTIHSNGVSSGPIVGEFTAAAGSAFPTPILPDVRVPGQVYLAVSGSGTASGVLYVR